METQIPLSVLSDPSTPLTLDLTVRIGSHHLRMRGHRLIQGPVFQAHRLPSNSRLRYVQVFARDVLLQFLPLRVQGWLRHTFPEWFLPTRLIVKELDPARVDAFNTEHRIYNRLQDLQGLAIPVYYGAAAVQHTGETEFHQAHLIELVHGTPLSEFTRAQAASLHMGEKIQTALAIVGESGVVHGDPWPRHFIHTHQGGLQIIDWGEAYVAPNAHELNLGDGRNAMDRFFQQCDGTESRQVMT